MQGEGEIKAHDELTTKYGIEWKRLSQGRIRSISLWQAVRIERGCHEGEIRGVGK